MRGVSWFSVFRIWPFLDRFFGIRTSKPPGFFFFFFFFLLFAVFPFKLVFRFSAKKKKRKKENKNLLVFRIWFRIWFLVFPILASSFSSATVVSIVRHNRVLSSRNCQLKSWKSHITVMWDFQLLIGGFQSYKFLRSENSCNVLNCDSIEDFCEFFGLI